MIAAFLAAVATKISQVWWVYALIAFSTGAGAVLCYLQNRRLREMSFPDFVAFVFPKRVILHHSARLDLGFVAVRWLTFPFFIAPFLFSSSLFGYWIATRLAEVFGPSPELRASLGSEAALTAALMLATDLGVFVSHLLQHKIPLLWHFHKVHHAAQVLIPPTVQRIHPVDEIGRLLWIAFCTAIVGGVYLYFFGIGMYEAATLGVIGVDAYFLLDLLIFYPLRHSHLPLRFGRVLEHLFVSPAMHQLHHSAESRHFNRNFAFTFAFWDSLIGTRLPSTAADTYRLGLPDGEDRAYDRLWALYLLPFANVYRRRASTMRAARRRFRQRGIDATR